MLLRIRVLPIGAPIELQPQTDEIGRRFARAPLIVLDFFMDKSPEGGIWIRVMLLEGSVSCSYRVEQGRGHGCVSGLFSGLRGRDKLYIVSPVVVKTTCLCLNVPQETEASQLPNTALALTMHPKPSLIRLGNAFLIHSASSNKGTAGVGSQCI